MEPSKAVPQAAPTSSLRVSVLLIAALAAAVGIAITHAKSVESLQPSGESLQIHQSHALRGTHQDSTHSTVRTPIPPTTRRSLTIRVFGNEQRPVLKALLRSIDSLERTMREDQMVPIGETDESGTFVLSETQEQHAPPKNIQILAQGYVAQTILSPEWGYSYAVRLPQGTRFVARTVTPAGAPIEGALLLLSQSPIQSMDYFSLAECGPGAVPTEAIYSSLSDREGRVVIEGIAPGSYSFYIMHRSYVWLDPYAQFPEPGVYVPCADVIFEMRRIVGCHKRIEGVRVLAKNNLSAITPGWHSPVFFEYMLSKMADADESVICFARGEDADGPKKLVARVFLVGEGWREFAWPLRPLVFGEPPENVAVAPPTVADRVSGALRVTLHDLAGQQLPMSGLYLFSTQGEPFHLRIKNGVTREVPAGQYKLLSSEPFLNREILKVRVHVKPGEENNVDMGFHLLPCCLDLRVEGGRELAGIAGAVFEFENLSMPIRTVVSGETLLLPPGPARIDILTQLFPRYTVGAVVDPRSASRQVIKCQLE